MTPLRSPPANTKRSPSCGRALRGSACAIAAWCISQPNPAPQAAFNTRRLLLIMVRSPRLNHPPQLTVQDKIYSETDASASVSRGILVSVMLFRAETPARLQRPSFAEDAHLWHRSRTPRQRSG